MRHHRDVLIFCGYGIILAAVGTGIWREYYNPYSSDPAGAKAKRLRSRIYLIEAIGWIVIMIAQWWK